MEKVDMLAWLDAEISAREGARSSGAHAAGYSEAKRVRDAVERLITAAAKYRARSIAGDGLSSVDLDAALARVSK